MDLALYARVLWRFRLLVVLGLLLAVTLALLSIVRVSTDGLTYRQQEQWVSRAMLLITEPQFPEGRSVFEQSIPPVSTDEPQTYAAPFANPDRFVALANLYSQLATSDVVRRILLEDGRLNGAIEAAPVATVNGAASLPLLSIGGIATTPQQARVLAKRAVAGFLAYLEREQQRSKIPAQQRVVLDVVKQPTAGELLKGRPKTLPVIVFMTVMLAVCGIAFALENIRPRIKPPIEEVRPAAVRDRRTA